MSMIPIIKKRERKEWVTYDRCFDWRGEPENCGFGFPCDKEGNILPSATPEARENYLKCLNGDYDVIDKGIREWPHSYVEPAQARCHCGHIIQLAAFTNTCERCGLDYNMSGQDLAARSQWGWDTGETPSEILAIGHHIS